MAGFGSSGGGNLLVEGFAGSSIGLIGLGGGCCFTSGREGLNCF
jgi:hypothetical protein